MVSNLMTRVVIKRRKFGPRDIWGEHPVKVEAEAGVICLQAKEHPGLPATTMGLEGSSPTDFRESTPCRSLDFGCPASRTVREYISVVLSHPVCDTLSRQP